MIPANFESADMVNYLIPIGSMVASTIFITFVVCLSFNRRQHFLPHEPEERKRVISSNRKKKIIIITLVWVVELFGAVVGVMDMNAPQ